MIKKTDRRHSVFALLTFFACIGLCLPFIAANAATRKAQPQRAAGGAPLLLVLPFQVNAGSFGAAGDELAPALAIDIANKGLATVSAEKTQRLLDEFKVTTLDTQTVRKLAAAAKATHAVYGAVSQSGETVSIDARLVPTAGGAARPMFVEQRGGSSSIVPAVADLASRIVSEFTPKRGGALSGVEVRGTKVLDPEVVLMRINTRKGDMLDSAAIDAEVKKIWELGYFSDVSVNVEQRADGPVVVYTVTEKPRIESIVVEGSSDIDEEDVISVMSSKVGSIINDQLLAEDIQKILELYRKSGFYLAQVSQKIMPRQEGSTAEIVLTVSEGKKLYIKNVIIQGAEQMSESDVKGQMNLSERGMISWITGSGVLKEELIERDASAIAAYYLNNGFLDVVVAAAKIDYEEDGIIVTFPVSEGKRYKLGKVIYSGELIDTEERLNELIGMDELTKDHEFFNLAVMQEDSRKLTDHYSDFGYAFAEINARPVKVEGAEPVVDVVFDFEKKNKVYVRRVLVEGNNKTRDNVILREMRVTDGEPFVGSKLRRSSERLGKLGYFEVAEAELVPTSNEEEVDLKIKVKERPTGALIGGVGYSTFSQVGVSGTLMESNLWGKGYNVSLQAAFSGRRDAFTFSFTNPRWNDTDLSVGTDLYHWKDDYIDYTKRTTGGVMRFSYPLGEYTSLGWGYRLDQYKLYDLEDDASKLIRDYATGQRYSSVLLGRITRDTTDKLRPTNGNIDKLSVEYGGGLIGGDDDFITVTAEHQTYYELAKNHVLHGRVKGSAIFTNGEDEVPVFERFWMGGIESVRGYNSRDIVPIDKSTGDRIGGTRMAFANFEYIWSVSNEFGINLVPFFDIGVNLDADHDYTMSDEIKKSFGTEVRWRSPLGDLRFSYGIPLDENRDGKQDSGRFEFSMGQFF